MVLYYQLNINIYEIYHHVIEECLLGGDPGGIKAPAGAALTAILLWPDGRCYGHHSPVLFNY